MNLAIRIALVGDYNPDVIAHRAIPTAIKLSAITVGREVDGVWFGTDAIATCAESELASFDGFWCVPASPYRSTDGALRAIRYAREHDRPFLGTCGGFQHALIEIARNVLRIRNAGHAELDPAGPALLVTPLACALVETSGEIRFSPGSRIAAIYGTDRTTEQYHCSFGLNEAFAEDLQRAGLQITGRDDAGSARVFELHTHRFFVATLFQPERSALDNRENPLVTSFVRACASEIR